MTLLENLSLLAIFLYVGSNWEKWFYAAVKYFENRAIIKSITPTAIKEDRLCKQPHTWLNTRTWTEKGTVDARICRVCGLIDGTNKMATIEAIDQIEENNKIQALEEGVYQDFIDKENKELRAFFAAELKEGLSFDKLAMLHNAGITFGARFNKYKVARLPEMLKELVKSNA